MGENNPLFKKKKSETPLPSTFFILVVIYEIQFSIGIMVLRQFAALWATVTMGITPFKVLLHYYYYYYYYCNVHQMWNCHIYALLNECKLWATISFKLSLLIKLSKGTHHHHHQNTIFSLFFSPSYSLVFVFFYLFSLFFLYSCSWSLLMFTTLSVCSSCLAFV